MAGKEDFEASKRARLFSRIATGNWDGVIVTHASFEKIPMSYDSRKRFIDQQIREVELAIRQQRAESRGTRLVKELERIKKKLKAKLETLSASHRKDSTLTFEELGIDRLFVDEAHKFKNLFYVTKMNRVAGLPQTASERAFDLFLKVQYIQERNQGGGVVFATGTPISNTMAEMFTMQRYLQMHTLRRNQMQHFDSLGGHVRRGGHVHGTEPRRKWLPAPNPFRALRQRAGTHGPVPAGGRRAHGRDAQIAGAQARGRQAGDDQRPGQPGVEAFRRTPRRPHRGHQERPGRSTRGQHAQDHQRRPQGRAGSAPHGAAPARRPGFQGQPGGRQRAPHLGENRGHQRHADGVLRPVHASAGNRGDFNVYDDVRAKLVARGIPAEQIAFIQDYDEDAAKSTLFKNVREGKVRVLLGARPRWARGPTCSASLRHSIIWMLRGDRRTSSSARAASCARATRTSS